MTLPRSRRSRLIAGGAAAAALSAGLVLAVPLAASAHVTVAPDAAASAGGYDVLTFAFSHGCEESPTTAISIDMPQGLDSVTPTIEPGWQVAVTRENGDGLVQNVTYTADTPVPTGFRSVLELAVKFADDTAGQTLTFPVVQTCSQGSTSWTDVPAEGQDPESVEHPAPSVAVGPAATGGMAGHDDGDGDGDGGAPMTAADAVAAPDPAGTVAVWLGAGGLALGVAGLVTALAALRRARR